MESQNHTEFTNALIKYQKTGNGYRNLIEKIGIHVYTILKSNYKMEDDERGDFFCIYYPKIPNLIKQFEYYGTPFEIYLKVSLKWNIKSFRTSKSKYRSIQKAIYTKPFYLVPHENDFTEEINTDLHISEYARAALQIEGTKEILTDTVKKRLLYIYLIEADYLDERIKERIIRMTGYKKRWVETCSEKLKKKVDIRLNRIIQIKNRRNSAFFEFHLLQERCSFEENRSEKEVLENQIKNLRRKINSMNREISNAIVRPTHKDLADILQIPKGSIDSGIFYIKNSFNELENIEKKSA